MILSVERACQVLGPQIPPRLIDASAWDRICALAAGLPPLFGWGIFECRLREGENRVDALFCISRREGGRAALTQWLAQDHQRSTLGPAGRFLGAWLETGGLLEAEVPLAWLEYDLPGSGPDEPFVQFCVDREYPNAHRSPALTPLRLRSLAQQGLGLLLGRSPDSVRLAMLERCVERLPLGGRILHLGVMPRRGTDDIRMLAAIPTSQAAAWLDAIAWPGDPRQLSLMMDLIGDRFSRLSVQLDVGTSIGPQLAIEFPMTTRPDRDPAWVDFMDRLAEAGLCHPAKAQSALDWIGEETVDLPDAEWLVSIDRRLDVKVIANERGALEAKAYLCFHPRYVLV